MDEFQRELERKKQKWEENVKKQNEEKKQKEIERKKLLAEQKKQKEMKKLEELKKQTDVILEEERKRMEELNAQKKEQSAKKKKSSAVNESRETMCGNDSGDEAGMAEFNMLESLVKQDTIDLEKYKNKHNNSNNDSVFEYDQKQQPIQQQKDNNSKNIMRETQKDLQESIKFQQEAQLQNQQSDEEDELEEQTIPQKEFARLMEDQKSIRFDLDESVQLAKSNKNMKKSQLYIPQDSLVNSTDFILKATNKYQQPFTLSNNNGEDLHLIDQQSSQNFKHQDQNANTLNNNKIDTQNNNSIKSVNQVFNYNQQQQREQQSDDQLVKQQQIPQQQQKKLLGRKEEFLMKMSMEEQMKKMSKAQQDKKRKEEEEIMRKKQQIFAQVMGKKDSQQKPIQNQIIQEQYEQEDSNNNSYQLSQDNRKQQQIQLQQQKLDSHRSDKIEESCSLNDRDSEYNEDDYVQHNPDKFGVTSHFGADGKPSFQQLQQQNFMKPSSLPNLVQNDNYNSPQTQQTDINDNDSELYKYSSDNNSNNQNDYKYQSINQVQQSNQKQQQVEDSSNSKLHSRIQSASSKNRQEHYDNYQMNMSIQSQDYDKLYQHGRTKELQDMNSRLSQTQSQFHDKLQAPQFDISYGDDHLRSSINQKSQSSIKEDSDLQQTKDNLSKNSKLITFGKDQQQNQQPIDYSQSLVHIESSLGNGQQQQINQKYQDDDLPEELREYERQLLAQIDQDEQDLYDEDFDNNIDDHQDQQLEQPSQQIETLDSKFRVSLADPIKYSQNKFKPQQDFDKNQSYTSQSSNDTAIDPLKEYYQLQQQKLKQMEQEQQDDFDNQFDQEDDHQPNQNDEEDEEYNNDNFDNDGNQSDEDDTTDVQEIQKQHQKGIALDFGIDEGTIKERKLKRFEELKQRKMQEMEERKLNRDKSGDRTAAAGHNAKRIQHPMKSPLREKSPLQSKQQQVKKQSPYQKQNIRDKSPVQANKQQPIGNKVIRRPAASQQSDEEEKNMVQVSQSKFDYIQNKNVPLSANVPQHLLKKQQQKQDESQISSHPTPKQTPSSQNPSSKKNFTKNSNKKLIKNAINVILGGETNKNVREEVMKVLDETDHPYYIITFRGNLGRQDYKALYFHDGTGQVQRLHGPPTVPEILHDHMIEKFFRYDSGNKVFKELPGIKGFTLTTDAVALLKKYNQKVASNILY